MSSSFLKIKNTKIKERFFCMLSDKLQDWVSAVFYSTCIAIFILLQQHFNLTSFNERSISRATIENFDISARVNTYYLILLFFFFSCILFKFLATKVSTFILSTERNLINIISLTGILLLLFGAFTVQTANIPIYLVFGVHGILFIKIILRLLKKEKSILLPSFEYDIFIFSLLCSVIVFIICKRVSLIFNFSSFVNFYIFFLIAGILIYCLLWNYLMKFKETDSAEKCFYNLLKYVKPFSLIPFTIVLSTEIYLFFNHKSVYNISQSIIFIVLTALLFLWFLFKIFIKQHNKNKIPDYKKLLYNIIFPLFITGIAFIIFYNPLIPGDQGLFETANTALSVEQYFDFQKVPFIDTFGSHELSEIAFQFIYTAIYGFSDLSFLIYGFISQAIAVILIYFFLLKYTNNPYLTIFILLFFPFILIVLPTAFCIILLALLILIYTIKKQTIKSFFLFFCFLIFLFLWRIDIGFAAFPAGIISIIIFSFVPSEKRFNFRALIKGIFYFVLFSGSIFVILYAVFGQKIIISITDAYSYFNSAQSYGFPDLAKQSDLFFFLTQYFVIPVIIIGLITYATLSLIRNKTKSDNLKNSLIAYVFLGLFYLLNFQRGLIRHSLIEDNDINLMSIGFFLIGGSIFFIKYSSAEVKKFIYFIIITSLVILAFKFPRDEARKISFFGLFINKTDSFPVVNESDYEIKRVVADSNFETENLTEIVKFLKANLQNEETFIDFTNSPMLYFYSQKENPVFFNQPLICSHNEYLQKRFIEQVKQHDAPFVLFSKFPESSSDIIDGLPNAMRHFLIAEYIYTHYKPCVIINNYCVWKRTDYTLQDSFRIVNLYYDKIPAGSDSENVIVDGKEIIKISLQDKNIGDDQKRLFLAVNYSSDEQNEITLKCILNDTIQNYSFDTDPDSSVKLIEIKHLAGETLKEMQLLIPAGSKIILKNVSIIMSDYIPDVFATRRICFSGLKYAPYIWGQYDKKSSLDGLKNSTVLISDKFKLKAHCEKKIDFSPEIIKDNGNYLIINALNETKEEADLTVKYGIDDEVKGSYIFKIRNGESVLKYVLRISMQYNWMAYDNNWVSLTSDKDIDVESMEITEAD
jgi:hypothetical protein